MKDLHFWGELTLKDGSAVSSEVVDRLYMNLLNLFVCIILPYFLNYHENYIAHDAVQKIPPIRYLASKANSLMIANPGFRSAWFVMTFYEYPGGSIVKYG